MNWGNQIELKKRENANIQQVYGMIPSPKSADWQNITTYIIAISRTHNR
jgi:hypothetical protein